MGKFIKYLAGIVPLLLPELIVSYALQLIVMISVSARRPTAGIAMMLAGPATILLINGIFVLLNRKHVWFEKAEAMTIICLASVLYGLMMFLVFPLIPIPYQYIPAGEMAMGFGQLLIQLFDCFGAAICLGISGIRLLLSGKE